jgi:hypothetical protein
MCCILMLGLAAACGAAAGDPTVSETPFVDADVNPDVNPDADARAVAAAGTVSVRAHGCGPQPDRGTGSVIDSAGLIVTAAHVVAGADLVEVDGPGGSSDAEVVWFDGALDVALVRTRSAVGEPVTVSPIAPTTPTIGLVALRDAPEPGVSLVAAEVLRSVTIATTDIARLRDVTRPGFEVAAEIARGDSGAMVYVDGVGIGIIWARSTQREGRAWAVALPDVVTDPQLRARLVDPVDNADCP